MDNATALGMTVNVAVDGTVTRGVLVTDQARNIGQRPEMLSMIGVRRARNRRFIPAGVPNDVWITDPRAPYGERLTRIQQTTLPHDCENHLTGPGL